MNIDSAIREIASVVEDVAGIEQAPTYPPEGTAKNMVALTYVQNGNMEIASEGARHSLWDVNIDILRRRVEMSKDMEALLSVLDPLKDALAAEVSWNGGTVGDQFDNTIETFLSLKIEFIPEYDYQSVKYIGYRFTMIGVKFIE
jgi:hypothetical protein